MSFVLLHADRLRSVVAGDALIPADQVDSVRDASALLVEAGVLRDAAEQDIAKAREAAHAAGLDEGRNAARDETAAGQTETLARLEAAAIERDVLRQADVARLAIEVVRRIAGKVEETAMLAGIAERATAALVTTAGATVRVTPDAVEPVRVRLADRVGVSVEGDATLDPLDCVVETPLGRTRAGFETQLAAIERAWTAR